MNKTLPGIHEVLILLVLISLAPMLATVIYQSVSEQQSQVEQAKRQVRRDVQLRAAAQRQLIEGMRHMIGTVAHTVRNLAAAPEKCDEYLRDVNEHFSEYSTLGFATLDGNVVCRSLSGSMFNIADRPYFKNATATGRFTVGEYMIGRFLKKPLMPMSLPVHDVSGNLIGVQYATIDLSALQARFNEVDLPEGMTAVVMDTMGVVLAAAGANQPQPGERVGYSFLLEAVRNREPLEAKATDVGGQGWLYAFDVVRAEGSGAVLVASMMPSHAVLADTVRRLRLALSMLLLVTLGVSVVAWWIGREFVAAPIDQLLTRVRAMEHGDTATTHTKTAHRRQVREVARIERGIDELALALAMRRSQRDAAMAQLQQSEKRFRAQFESSPQAMWIFDATTLRFLIVNDAAVAHYGYSREEFLTMTVEDIRPAEDIAELRRQVADTRSRGQQELFTRHKNKHGDIMHVQLAAHRIDWDGHEALAVIAYDITSRVMAEQSWSQLHQTLEREVAQRTRELEIANRELEAFSYSVSHDLRAPIGIIEGFCAALTKLHQEELSPTAVHYIDRIRTNATRMNMLVSDLLSLAKTGRDPLVLQQVDLAVVASEVVAELQRRFHGRRVSVTIEQGLVAVCDRRLMAVVLENLIGNAWKFTAQTNDARIRVGRAPGADSATTIVVGDNGAGFDGAYADKLFKPFQRLHSTSEFEGTGIGLAIVYRIIQRHGGEVWAESEVGKGARFFVRLPAEQAAGSAHASPPAALSNTEG